MMYGIIKSSLRKAHKNFGLHYLTRKRLKNKPLILAYHGIISKGKGLPENIDGLHIDRDHFLKHIKFLKKHYNIVPLNELRQHLINGTPLPENAVSITFDDGYENNYLLLWPLIKEYNLPITIFLTVGLINSDSTIWPLRLKKRVFEQEGKNDIERKNEFGKKMNAYLDKNKNHSYKYFNECYKFKSVAKHTPEREYYGMLKWNQVLEMAKDRNIEFGSHGLNHIILSHCRNNDELVKEICSSKKTLEQKLGRQVDYFAYPNGKPSDINQQAVHLLRQAGFKLAFSCIKGKISLQDDKFHLKRFPINNNRCIEDISLTL